MPHVIVIILMMMRSGVTHAEPICLGQKFGEDDAGQPIAEIDTTWFRHGWFYTTNEGVETNACVLCEGEWEPVPYWIAGLEAICPQTGQETVVSICSSHQFAPYCWELIRPVFDWGICQDLIMRCPMPEQQSIEVEC